MTRADVPRYHAEPVETDWTELIAAWQSVEQARTVTPGHVGATAADEGLDSGTWATSLLDRACRGAS